MNDNRIRYRRRSLFGPLLVAAIGVVILLGNLGKISYPAFWWWFGQYWPIILIVWGLFKLGEYAWARQHNEPYPGIGGGGVVFLIFFILFGVGVSGARHWNWVFDSNDDWGWGFFGTRYDFTESFATPMPAGKEVRVLSAYGDITIMPSPDDQAHLLVHKYFRGNSQDEANEFNTATHPKFEQQGSVWLLDLSGGNFTRGRFNLEIQVPPKYAVSLSDRHGDIRASQIQADIELETDHGDITAEQIKGNVLLHARGGDVTAKSVSGNVNVDGNVGDSTFSDIGGSLTMTGSYSGIELSHVASQVKFSSSRTDLQMSKLDGDLSMDHGDLKANSVAGPFILRTDAKNVRLDSVTGDVHIDDRRGDIEMQAAAPMGSVEITTTDEEIKVSLPENPGFQVDAQSAGGRIQSDYSLSINNDRSTATAIGTVGKGGPLVRLKTNRGTIQIRKD